MQKRSSVVFMTILSGVLLLFSCKREEATSWQTELSGPIAAGRITLHDIVPDSLLTYDENCLWHLSLSENLTDFDLDSIVQIPDTTINKSFVVPVTGGPFNIPEGQVIINQEENNQIMLNDVQLREVDMKSGFLEYSIRSYIDGYLDCKYEIPGVTIEGIGIIINTTTEPSIGDIPYVQNGSIDLSGHNIDLTGESGFMFNRIYSHLTISAAVGAPTGTSVSGGDSIVIQLKFVDPVVKYARGYFGEHSYDLSQSVDFSEQINFPEGSLNINDATMKMHIVNSVGTDARIQFSSLSNYNSYYGSSVQLESNQVYDPINITRAYDNLGNIESTEYLIDMNVQNSNIDAFIENLPDQLSLQANVLVNPLGNVTDGNDFIYTDKALQATLDLDIPLAIGAQNLVFRDTIEIAAAADLSASGQIYLYLTNYFPFSAICDLHLIDAEGVVKATFLSSGIVNSAIETDTPGLTIPSESVIPFNVSAQSVSLFNPAHRLVLKVKFATPDFSHPSKLYKNYYMDFKVVADGEVILKYE